MLQQVLLQKPKHQITFLQKSILVNAIFSLLSGVLFILAQDFLIAHIPLNSQIWTLLGVGLVLFSVQLVLMIRSQYWANKLILSVIFSDIGWIILTFTTAIYYQTLISNLGLSLILFVNILVSALAWFQFSGYLRNKNSARLASGH